MNPSVRLFLAAENEYRRGLAHRLIEEKVVDFCLAANLPYTEHPSENDKIVTVDIRPCLDLEYSIICDINSTPAVSLDLLERMLPFESMALKMGIRRSDHVPICEYEDEKRKYLHHIRFWNYMLDKYNINMVAMHCMPHSQGMYVIYALARIKGIPVLITDRAGIFNERKVWGDSVESMGDSIGKRYEILTQNGVDEFELDEDIERDYLRALERVSNDPIGNDGHTYCSYSDFDRRKFRHYYIMRRNDFLHEYIRYTVRAFLKPDTKEDLVKREAWFRLRKKQLRSYKYYIEKQSYTPKEINRMAELPDYSKQYICFFLQIYPERSLIPMAGVFAEQYNSIQMLARAAEKTNCLVYVREHPLTNFRSKDLFSEIKQIKNVRLIRSDVSAVEIMRNSVAIATQTGTCIIEAGLLGKPVIVFGKGYVYKKCPSVFEMHDEEQGEELIKRLLEGVSIPANDMKRYFYAMQLESIKEDTVEEEYKRVFNSNYVVPPFPLDDRIEQIKRFIGSNIG